MKTLFISPNSPFESVGGIERSLLNVIEHYKDESHHKTFVLLPTREKNSIKKIRNVTIHLDTSLFIEKHSSPRVTKEKARQFGKRITEYIVKDKIDVICVENFHLGLPAAYSLMLNMICMQYKIPVVLRVHSFAATTLQMELVNQLPWSKVSCVSKSVAGDCFHKGTSIDVLSTDYLGVDTKQFTFKSDGKEKGKRELGLSSENLVILTASRIVLGTKNILGQKGIITLLEAFSKLAPRYPQWRLVIAVGKPPQSLDDEYQKAHRMLLGYIQLHNVEQQTIVQTVPLDEMPKMYNSADVFVLPSENETFGQVFIEAMACRVPVIGSKVGGIPEIISDSYNGFLVPPHDASVLAHRIEKILIDPDLQERFVTAGMKTVDEKFTLDIQSRNFATMLKNASERVDA